MEEGHEALAGFYPGTAMPDSDWWEALWPHPEKTLADLGIKPGMSVVDLCCGDGLFTIPLAHIAEMVIGIDLDPQMLRLAKAQAERAGVTNVRFIAGDAYDLASFVIEPVDYVLMANTFHGVPDKLRLSRTIASVLKPRGNFAIVNWHQRPREETVVLGKPRGPKIRMTPREVVSVVEPAGYSFKQIAELPPYHYGAILEKLEHLVEDSIEQARKT